ncbi:haloacid dehalogenase type II [Nocardioides sp. DS6]|uniref:Haloacid dehalogenase type II n=1 Tax=Nocardioides eburneus TaxID=3231482 RepID=A0ABV3SZA0_9ACTN
MSESGETGHTATGTPAMVIFDVNETLSDLGPLAGSFERIGLTRSAVEPWFAGVLRDGFALTVVGVRPRFADLASEALRVRLAAGGAGESHPVSDVAPDVESSVDEVMRAFASLSVQSDVVDGVHALQELGVRLVTLSNGSAALARGLVERAGLEDAFETLMSVEDAAPWKPHPASYAHALDACGVSAADAMLVAVHPWDIDGAARAGLRTGWLNRNGARYPNYFIPPDVVATDLVELADALR